MAQKYGKWNNASFYPNCNRLNGYISEYSTEKMLYGDAMEVQVRHYYNNDYMKIGGFEMNILIRVAASDGVTKGQLEKYLILQGMIIDENILEDRLYNLVKFGYLSWVKFRRLKDNFEIQLYDITARGLATMKHSELPERKVGSACYSNNDFIRAVRNKIVSNQIVLHLLCEQANLKSFYFQRELLKPEIGMNIKPITVPLYIQTDSYNYIIEYVSDTRKGKESFKERMNLLHSGIETLAQNTVIVLVAETYAHMEMLSSETYAYEKDDPNLKLLYTHDSEWFYDTAGHFYAMARAMGQSGIMGVKML